MEWREFGGEYIGGAVEGILRAGVKMHVPYLQKPRGILRGRWVLRIRGQQQFWKLTLINGDNREMTMNLTFGEKLKSLIIRFLLHRSS